MNGDTAMETEIRHDPTENNIISLAEEGLLSPNTNSRRENAIYYDYSPLNEW